MSLFVLVVIVALAVFCWYGYRELKQMEVEILADIEAANARDAEVAAPVDDYPDDRPEPATELEKTLLEVIRSQPGIMQSTVYPHCPQASRRQVQQTLQEMEQRGVIRREKARGSYRLHTV